MIPFKSPIAFILLSCLCWGQLIGQEEAAPAQEGEPAAAAETPLAEIPPVASTPINERYKPLLDNSPFITPDFRQRLAGTQSRGASNIAFMGYAQIGDKWLINLYDKRGKEGQWVEVGGSFKDVEVVRFNQRRQQLTVNFGGQELTLNLEKR